MAIDDDEFFPNIGATGSAHSVSDDDGPPPRLWGLKSVSKAAARALDRRPTSTSRSVGFVHGRIGR